MAAKRKAGALLQHVLPKESLNQDQSEITDDEHFSGVQLKDADKVKLLLLAWNLQTQKKAGDMATNKRTSLSISDKIDIIRALEGGKKNAAVCRQFDLSSSTVSTLWKNRRTIIAALKNNTVTRKKMRNCSAVEVDRALLRWFGARRDAGLPVSGPILTKRAEKLAKQLGEENFSCNNGWLDRFKRRHGIVYSSLPKSRNGDGDGGAGGGGGGGGDTNMADLWASYHSALGLAGSGAGASAGAARRRDQPSPVLLGTGSEGPGGAHDETSSSAGNGKEDEDTLASDDESDDRLDPQHHDPERLKAFNMFVRLFVDENLDRMVPISKQPKEKIQAIIDSCTRQFPEFAERARKRIRTYLKSCRRNKKVRDGNASAGTATPAWDATIRPTPAHLTSVQAEQILAQACENESHNAKRMRLGLEPVSQPMPTTAASMSMDTTAPTVPHAGLLGVYGGGGKGASQDSPAAPAPPSLLASLHNGGCHTGNSNAAKGEGGGSKSASPASSPALPLFRANFPQSFGQHQQGRQSSRTSTPSASVSATDFTSSLASSHLGFGHAGLSGAPTANALLSTLGAVAGLHGPGGAGGSSSATNAAVAAYQSALFSAAMAHQGQGLNFGGLGVALAGNGPTDLSMKNTSTLSSAFPASLSSATAASALGLTPPSSSISHTGQNSTKPLLLSHKLNTAEMAAVRQLITGYRESAAFLLRSADELETLLLQQP